MSVRELVVLGTASQVPTRHRNHNGYLVLWDGQGFLFDPGEGTQRQMLFAGVSASQITAICVTHFHGDHCLGLAGIVQRISLDRVEHEIPVYYPASGQVYLDRLLHASIFDDRSHIVQRPVTRPGPQSQGDPALIAHRLDHTAESWGYRIQEPPRVHLSKERLAAEGITGRTVATLLERGEVEVGGRRIGLEAVSERTTGGAVAVVMDTRTCDGALALARDVDVLVIESTYLSTERVEAAERGHLTARQAAEIGLAAGAKRIVLTHFSQRYPSVEPFVEEAREVHPNVVAAQDGSRVGLRPDRNPR
ncbi:MAG: ribonuclease Z [Myxococcota bacterium]